LAVDFNTEIAQSPLPGRRDISGANEANQDDVAGPPSQIGVNPTWIGASKLSV
jgi:hypothetical protein